MKVLVLNSGSSSVKFQLIEMASRTVLGKGVVERIGASGGLLRYLPAGRAWVDREMGFPDHKAAITVALDALTDGSIGVIPNLSAIDAVGHRMVLGGPTITKAVLLDDAVVKLVEEYTKLAPLHNPPTLMGFRAAHAFLSSVPHVGVFDTAFTAGLPPTVRVYPIPYEFYEKHGIRRFSYHGTSHKYVSRRAAEILGREPRNFRCVTCHLGNGCSALAVKDGTPVDTSLGFGTVAGLMMGTRSGDVDPDALLYLLDGLKMEVEEVRRILYRESGLKGVSGISNDLRDVERAADGGNARARLALDMFAHHASRYVASLALSLEGRLDALVFTAGMGENSPRMRAAICRRLALLGIRLDEERNGVRGKEAVVSAEGSAAAVLVVPTNEELMIALETEEAVRRA
jgi:acetate kinase